MVKTNYVITHKRINDFANFKENLYVKYNKQSKTKRYIVNVKEATVFDKMEAKAILKTFNHPENWEIVKFGGKL